MFVVMTLLIMGLLPSVFMQGCFLLLVVLLIAIKYMYRDAILLFLAGFCFLLVLVVPLPNVGSHYRVVEKRAHYAVVRNGLNTYRIYDQDVEYDAVYFIDGVVEDLESRTVYQRMRRLQGSLSVQKIEKVAEARWFHRFLMHQYREYPELIDFIYQEYQHLIISLALHCYGMNCLLYHMTRRFLARKKRILVSQCMMVLYGVYFGFSLSVVRLILKDIPLKREVKMLILMFVFPMGQFHLGFMLSFFPDVIASLIGAVPKHSLGIARIYLIHTLTGSVHIVQMVLLKVWVYLIAGVYVLLFLNLKHLAVDVLLKYQAFLLMTRRFELRGGISILVFGIGLFMIRKPLGYLLSYLSVAVFVCYFPFPRVMFVDVGQGDATVITTAFNAHATLIDTGREFALSDLESALMTLGVRYVDQLIITHSDDDHHENEAYILETYRVMHHVIHKGTPVDFLTELLEDTSFDDSNENSLIYLLQTERLSFLFMGDAYHRQEALILKQYPQLKVDVLKLGHHGSKTSTSESFIAATAPLYAVASSNPRIYNHPHPDVMRLLHQHRIGLLKTSEYGNITFVMTPFLDFVVSQQGHFGIIGSR